MINSTLFKQIFYQSRVPQLTGSADLKHTIVNDAFLQFIGYDRSDWSKLTIKDVSHTEDFKLDLRLFQELIEGQRKEYQIEKRYIHKSGVLVWGLLHITRIDEMDTNEPFFLAQIMDITEKKEMESALRKKEATYRLLAEHSSDVISLHSVDGTYLYVSPSVFSVTGYDPDEMVGTSPYDYIHPEDIENVKESLEELYSKGTLLLSTYRLKTKNGSNIWIESAIKPLISESTGEITELISVSRDIKQRIHTDELLRKSEKLAVVGQLAAAVAHEIRNPLTSIKGFIQLFFSSREYCTPKFSGIVLDELQRVEDIISEFLTMAKPHHEKTQHILLDQIVSQVIQLVRSQALLINKEIHFEVETYIPPILGDPNSLKQVFINIIQNALEAIQEKGSVHVRIYQDEQYVCINVQDNGVGIPNERLEKLGEPFYSTKEKGTGLGLMTCYRIVEYHQGKIKVESVEGEGTTFCVCLPLEEEQYKIIQSKSVSLSL